MWLMLLWWLYVRVLHGVDNDVVAINDIQAFCCRLLSSLTGVCGWTNFYSGSRGLGLGCLSVDDLEIIITVIIKLVIVIYIIITIVIISINVAIVIVTIAIIIIIIIIPIL